VKQEELLSGTIPCVSTLCLPDITTDDLPLQYLHPASSNTNTEVKIA